MKRKTKVFLFFLGTVLTASVSHYGARLVYSQSLVSHTRVPLTIAGEARPVEGIPTQMTIAYRSDGSQHARGRAAADGNGPVQYGILDVPNRRAALVDPLTRMVTFEPLRDAAVARLSTFPARCEDFFSRPGVRATCDPTTETAFGYILVRVRFGATDSGRGIRSDHEYLVIPELTFIPVNEKRFSNGRLVEERIVMSLMVGEPDPHLFSIPTEYKVASKPSEYFRAAAESRGRVADPNYLKMMDDKLARIRKQRGQ